MDEDELMTNDVVEEDVPTRTYKVVNGRIMGFVDDIEAMRQSVEKVLSTNRFEFEIYSDSYGAELDDLIGEQMSLAVSEVERLVTEALVVDDRILSIEDFSTEVLNKTSLHVKFVVVTIFGAIDERLEVEL